MNQLKFLSHTLISTIFFINYGFSLNVVKVKINKLPHQFQDAVFEIVFPYIGSGWSATLKHSYDEQDVPVVPHQNYQNIQIRRVQRGQKDVIDCLPVKFTYDTELKVEIKYNMYNTQFHGGLSCTVTGS